VAALAARTARRRGTAANVVRISPVECSAVNASTNVSIGVSAMSRPRPMMIRWSAVSATSLIRWLDTKTVRPSPAFFMAGGP
jgi:hypothetical protein